ncbi:MULTISPECIES: hypothetical protein [unclassified Sulfitobacter]|uniref:hypothetical protein n=1 Tax=unclassified Sulfitobacter TaxID=196795 RepID=UPI0015941970|nr:hypothetical protein [Sulfitobacter sp. HGT1]MBQ0803554.1 hypothetical protein [Sulfitobacter sp.]
MGKGASTIGICAALLTGSGAQAYDDVALYPAAQCAAFWLGFDDYAKRSPFLDSSPDHVKRSDAFRAVAVRLAPDRVTEIDRTIQDQRSAMALLAEAVIYANDKPSRKVFETLTQTCESFASNHPETRDLK